MATTYTDQTVLAAGVLEVRTYARQDGGNPDHPQPAADYDLSTLPFSESPDGVTYGVVAALSYATKSQWQTVLNGTPPPAGSPTGTPNQGGLLNLRAEQQRVLDGTPATPTTPAVVGLSQKLATALDLYNNATKKLPGLLAAARAYYAPIDAARQEVDHATNNLAYQRKFGDQAAQQAALARAEAAAAALQTALAAPADAVYAYTGGQQAVVAANVVWSQCQAQVDAQGEVVARLDAQIARAQGYASSAPDDPTGDNPPPVQPYVAYTLGQDAQGLVGGLSGGTVASCTYAGQAAKDYQAAGEPTPHCEVDLTTWDLYARTSGEYRFRFALAESDVAAMQRAGFKAVVLAWDELTLRYPLKTVYQPSRYPDDCPSYPVVVRDGDQPTNLGVVTKSETVSLDAGAPVVIGGLKGRVYTSSTYPVAAPEGGRSFDYEVQVASHRLPGTEVLVERQGASIERVGFAEYTTDPATPADQVPLYRTETASDGSGLAPARHLRDAALAPPLFPTVYREDEGFPTAGELAVLADYPGSGARVPTDTGMSRLSPTQRTGTALDGRTLTLTLSDPIDPTELTAAADAIAALDWIDDNPPTGSDGNPDLPVGYGNAADPTLTALHVQSPNGYRYQAQKARYRYNYLDLPSYPVVGGAIPYRLRRTTWTEGQPKVVDYLDVSAYPTAQQIATGGVPAPAEWTEVAVPAIGTTVLIEGCEIDGSTGDPHAMIFLGAAARVTPTKSGRGGVQPGGPL